MLRLFGWLRSFVKRDERCLFQYFDGVRQRSIDPLAAWRLVWSDEECRLLEDSTRAHDPRNADGSRFYPIGEVLAAEDRLRAMTRRIFGVKEWSQRVSDQGGLVNVEGLTLDETDELLNRFMAFIEDIKKKRAPLPTASVPMDSTELPPSSDTVDYLAELGCPAGPPPASSCSPIASTAAAPIGL